MDIIFIAGVHGVGKGTLSNSLSKKYSLPNFSASTLIASEKRDRVDINKVVKDPCENQDLLNTAIKRLAGIGALILLDGHFCLNTENSFFVVPISTFEKLNIKVVFLITEEVSIIHDRMLKRDETAMALKSIERLQNAEIARAQVVADHINVPLIFCDGGNLEDVTHYMESELIL
jgi:adenylate kinase